MNIVSETEALMRLRALVTYDRRKKDIAAKAGVSLSFVSAVLMGKKSPSPRMLELVGLERMTVYREIA